MPETVHQAEIEVNLHHKRELSLRQRHYFILSPAHPLESVSELRGRYPATSDLIAFGGVKLFVNGCAHDGYGHQLNDVKWPQEELNEVVLRAHLDGLQVWMHSLNSDGVRRAAVAVEEALKVRPTAHRHRIEHGGDYLDLADAAWLRRLGIRLVTTPQFLHSTSGEVDATHAPWRSLIDGGFRLIGGTDSTGTVPTSKSVLANIATAVTRLNGHGQVVGPNERATGTEALHMFTDWAAEGGFEENSKGVIRKGALGDLALLNGDPTATVCHVSEINVEATILGGEVVYEKD